MSPSDILKEELDQLRSSLARQITDPVIREKLTQMTFDAANMPARMTAGEDVSLLLESLKVEAMNYGVANVMITMAAVQQAWINFIFRLLTGIAR